MAQGQRSTRTPKSLGKVSMETALLADPWAEPGDDPTRGARAGSIVGTVGDAWVGTLRAVVTAGYGLTVSGTRDGGAVCIALLRDGEALKKYASDPDELGVLLERLRDHLSATSGRGGDA